LTWFSNNPNRNRTGPVWPDRFPPVRWTLCPSHAYWPVTCTKGKRASSRPDRGIAAATADRRPAAGEGRTCLAGRTNKALGDREQRALMDDGEQRGSEVSFNFGMRSPRCYSGCRRSHGFQSQRSLSAVQGAPPAAAGSSVLSWLGTATGNVPLVESQVASLRTSGSDFGFVQWGFSPHLFVPNKQDTKSIACHRTFLYAAFVRREKGEPEYLLDYTTVTCFVLKIVRCWG
jgi:hypothetical protein